MLYRCLPDWSIKRELASLSDLSRPPKELYYAGVWKPALFTKCVAVIGSRRMTEYGRRVIEKIIPRLVFEKKTIVSGFMYGVDQYAHRICIESGGKTIAVLGWGIKRDIDGADRKLAQAIVSSGGLLLSEWEDQEATLWTFPVRNRIVAALSQEVIVVEAAVKSGSLITASIAKKLKRTVWAVPGEITNRMSAGTNMLIAQGSAHMWIGDMLPAAPVTRDPLMNLLQNNSLTASEIARTLGKPVSDIGAQLSFLSLTGQIIERGGKYSYAGKN
jgi:DNA processing protein